MCLANGCLTGAPDVYVHAQTNLSHEILNPTVHFTLQTMRLFPYALIAQRSNCPISA